jgi:hypothetical protein
MVAFLEDVKEGEEIVIKGAIKKSSLSGVHKFLEEHEEGELAFEDEFSKEDETPRPRLNSMQLIAAEEIAEEDNDDDESSSEGHEDDGSSGSSSHHSQSIFTQDPFGLHENFDVTDKLNLKYNIVNHTAEELKADGGSST